MSLRELQKRGVLPVGALVEVVLSQDQNGLKPALDLLSGTDVRRVSMSQRAQLMAVLEDLVNDESVDQEVRELSKILLRKLQ